MKSLRQYIDLYLDHATEFRTGARVLDSAREGALKAVRDAVEAPAPRTAYAQSSLESLLEPDYGVNIKRFNFNPDLASTFRCGVPNISTLLGVTVNDVFRPSENLCRNLPAGVTVCSLAEAGRKDSESLEGFYNVLARNSNAGAALNTLLAQDGVLVRIADGVKLEKPVQLVDIFNSPAPMLACRRLLVVMGRDAWAKLLLCEHTQRHDVDYLSNSVYEIFCGEGSHLELYAIEENSIRTNRISNVYARQQAGSHLTLFRGALNGGVSNTSYEINLVEPDADTHLGGLVIADGKQVDTNVVRLNHRAPRGTSRQLFKYALFGDSRGEFGGKIIVSEGAVQTDASQTNRNLLASESARMATAPQLEIYCDDVRCGHGATTGQLDAAALFYMRTRGIPEEEARLMLTQAFMADVVESIGYDLVRDRLHQLVERRLGGERVSCATCAGSKTGCDS